MANPIKQSNYCPCETVSEVRITSWRFYNLVPGFVIISTRKIEDYEKVVVFLWYLWIGNYN